MVEAEYSLEMTKITWRRKELNTDVGKNQLELSFEEPLSEVADPTQM